MRHFTFLSAARTVAFAGLSALSMAGMQTAAAAGQPTLESLDKNGDGQISLNEASANDELFVAFKKLDTNRDGALSQTEFAAWSK
ncbi:MAG: EF-hand domain-containing protein [Steroidobacteraceae bacterium]